MSLSDRDVLYEDNHLLVVHKPAGLATMGADGEPTLHQWACDYFKKKYNKPGNVYVGVVSRLDSVTSGAIVFARTSKAAARLSAQFAAREGHVEQSSFNTTATSKPVPTKNPAPTKIYLAVLTGRLAKTSGTLENFVAKDDTAHRMRAVTSEHVGAKRAVLHYQVIDHDQDSTLVAVRLATGRKHQIRLQFSHLGHPVVADRKYGAEVTPADTPIKGGIALHSWYLQINHPTRREPLSFTCPIPEAWRRRFRALDFPSNLTSDLAESLGASFSSDMNERE